MHNCTVYPDIERYHININNAYGKTKVIVTGPLPKQALTEYRISTAGTQNEGDPV